MTSCDTSSLVTDARCFHQCFNGVQHDAVKIYLLCIWSGAEVLTLPPAPTNLQASSTTNQFIRLTWNWSGTEAGIFGFIIQVGSFPGGSDIANGVIVPANRRDWTFEYDRPSYLLYFQVAAYTTVQGTYLVGQSPFSNTSSSTTGTTYRIVSATPGDLDLTGTPWTTVEISQAPSTFSSLILVGMGNLTGITGGSGSTIGLLDIEFCNSLTALNLSSYSITNSTLRVADNPSLVTVLMPEVSAITDVQCQNNNVLVNVTPTGTFKDGTIVNFNNDALSDSSVNAILAAAVSTMTTSGNINLADGTNSAPTGQGIIDMAVLTGNGVTVEVNP